MTINPEPIVLRIGVHPNNLHLRLAALWPGAFSAVPHAFVSYEEGRDTGELLASGAIDVGGTGSTPPILAAARGLNIRYLAASVPRPANGAVLVPVRSEIRSIDALRNRRVALVDGSFLTYFLARTLEDAGLTLRDVARLDLSPTQSMRSLESGEADVWVAMAPHLERALSTSGYRVLAHCGPRIPNRSVFWTVTECALPDETARAFAAELGRIGALVTREPELAARLLAHDGDERDLRAWTRVANERNWQVVPASEEILREQQEEAATLVRHGDLRQPPVAGRVLS